MVRFRITSKASILNLIFPVLSITDPANAEISYETGMKSMHAVLANGEVITGVRVFRELYTTIGLGWLYGFTRYPVIKPIIDKLYDTWAVYRTDLTRGTPVDVLIQQVRIMVLKMIQLVLKPHRFAIILSFTEK